MEHRVTLMRVDIDILTNLKYNTSKMLMYSALLLLRCECRAEMQKWAAGL